jgi:hypothetical protein
MNKFRKNKRSFIIVGAVMLVALFLTLRGRSPSPSTNAKTATSTKQAATTVEKNPTIQEYIKDNISKLSPKKEVLGGKFQVVKITAHGGAGTVIYEDGHNAYTADFKYAIDESGMPEVTSFSIRGS